MFGFKNKDKDSRVLSRWGSVPIIHIKSRKQRKIEGFRTLELEEF